MRISGKTSLLFAVGALFTGLVLAGFAGESRGQALFKRGDLNGDGCVAGSADFLLLFEYFGRTPPPEATCLDAWDIADEGVSPVILGFLDFGALVQLYGSAPVCDTDPTPDAVTCVSYTGCSSQCDSITCVPPDNGTGTVDLPPVGDGCDYGTQLHILDGLPPGTEIQVGMIHGGFTDITRSSGGTLGGEIEEFDSTVRLAMVGTGSLAGFNRTIDVTAPTAVHTAPRIPGEPVQAFEADLRLLHGAIVGDPDFQVLAFTAGTANGLPSPGATILDQTGGGFHVDSTLNMTYEIDFVGASGSVLDGLSGTTQDQTLMMTGESLGQALFKRGDLNGDGCVAGSADFALFFQYFNSTPPPEATCLDAWDIADDGVSPVILGFLDFGALVQLFGSAPVCDTDPTQDAVTCVGYTGCRRQCDSFTCVPPDNGTGTVDLPPVGDGCDYRTQLHILDGLPPGTEIQVGMIHGGFTDITRSSGGTLGGEIEEFDSTVRLEMVGTGSLAGFNRTIDVTAPTEVHTAPRTPGEPVQAFETDLRLLHGAIVGDPDFQALAFTAGTANGLPSPGATILDQTGGGFHVDSTFIMTYEIDFVGASGSVLDGLSGTTQDQTLMSAPEPAGPLSLGPGLMLLAWLDRRRRRSAVV